MPNQRNEPTTERLADHRELMPVPPSITADADDVKRAGERLLEQAKSTAGEAYDRVAEKANSTLDEKKAGLTGGLSSVADSIRTAVGSLERTTDQSHVTRYSAQYAKTAAQKLEQTARYFESNDLKAMARDAENFARRNPAVFFGGAFVLGVLGARFFKSSPATMPMNKAE